MSIQKYIENFSDVSIEVINWELQSLQILNKTEEIKQKVYFLLSLKNNKLSQVNNTKLH